MKRARLAGALRFARNTWQLVGPYWSSNERWQARGLLALVVALTLGQTFLMVLYNTWNRRFFEALQDRDFSAFGPLLLQFGVLSALFIIAAVYALYFTQMLQIRWRRWLTQRFVGHWLLKDAYYHLEITNHATDNPDQRISQDLQLFTSSTLSLGLGLLTSSVTLVSFIAILWVISGPAEFSIGQLHVTIPGYMVWVALVYAIVGSVLTHRIGRPLIGLNFEQQRLEADFRFRMARLRENAEAVALYRGEATEQRDLASRFEHIRSNRWELMRYTKYLTFLTAGYNQLAGIFPLLVSAPRYFAGAIDLGMLTQIADAFGRVQGSLSWFVSSYSDLASWKATVDRLVTFQEAMDHPLAEAEAQPGIAVVTGDAPELRAELREVLLPDGRPVLSNLTLSIAPGERLLITGPNGAGKTTLFRALAGIWPFGDGRVEVPVGARMLFLPQRPYLPIASLRDAVEYPSPSAALGDVAIREVLRAVGLHTFTGRLDEVQNWSMQMSGGEQQRLAIARVLLQNPNWLFLDEATAALDEAAEVLLYTLLGKRLPEATIVSIAHRAGVARFHDRRLNLGAASTPDVGLNQGPAAAAD